MPRNKATAPEDDVSVEDSEGAGAGRRRRSPRRRQEILDAAARIFYEKGYEATTTQDIGDAVGLLKGSLYYYIESKEDFLYEIVKTQNDKVLAVIADLRASDGPALEKLVEVIARHIDLFAQTLTQSVVYTREARYLTGERKATIAAGGHAYLDAIRDLLREGQRDGSIDSTLDVGLLSVQIVGSMNYLGQWYRVDGPYAPSQIAREFAATMVTGVATEAGLLAFGGLEGARRQIRGGPTGRRRTRVIASGPDAS